MGKEFKVKVRLDGDSSGADRALKNTESRFQRFGASIRKNALAIGASLTAVVTAFRQIEKSAEEAGQKRAFERSLESQGIAADKFIEKLRDVSDAQIANADLVLATNRAIKLGIQADDIPGLLQKAAESSVDLGLSVTQAFDDITTGVGRASPLILDNLGIVVDSKRVYGEFAESIGKSTEELTKQERTIALTKAVIGEAAEATKNFSSAQDDMTRAINKSTAAMKNLRSSSGSVLSGLVQMTAGGVSAATVGLSLLLEGMIKLYEAIVSAIRVIPGLDSALEGVAERLKKMDDGIDGFQRRAAQFAIDLSNGGFAAVKLGLGIEEAGDKADVATPKLKRAAETTSDVAEEADNAKESADDLATSLDGVRGSSDRASESLRHSNSTLRETQRILAETSNQFDALADSIGRAAAIQAALDAGGRLTQGGTRIRFVTGGSRLVAPAAPGKYTGLSVGGGTFTTVQPVSTLPNGRIQ